MANVDLGLAKKAKKDEFYTGWVDIEKEMLSYLDYNPDAFRGKTILLPCDDPEWSNFTKFFALNFTRFGIKKLISTSYAPASNGGGMFYQATLFETEAPHYDPDASQTRGRKFVLTPTDVNGDGIVNVDDLHWEYLQGDGDFRSPEVTALRDEADMVITNPPFSLFGEFIRWVVAGEVEFSVLGNMNAIAWADVFPLVKANRLWWGSTISSGDREFRVPDSYPLTAAGSRVAEDGTRYVRIKGIRWFTNIQHGRRHEPLELMTMEDNKRFSRKKPIRENGYPSYDNYDAIDVGFTECIPSDYEGVMGVPITFLDKYNPDQFEIIWQASGNTRATAPKEVLQELGYRKDKEDRGGCTIVNGKRTYSRVFIRHLTPAKKDG